MAWQPSPYSCAIQVLTIPHMIMTYHDTYAPTDVHWHRQQATSHELFQVLGIVCLVASISIGWICPNINRIPTGRFSGKLPTIGDIPSKIAISMLNLPGGSVKSYGILTHLEASWIFFGQKRPLWKNGSTCHRQHSHWWVLLDLLVMWNSRKNRIQLVYFSWDSDQQNIYVYENI